MTASVCYTVILTLPQFPVIINNYYYFIIGEFLEVISKTELHKRIPFNMESPFVQLYFGKNKKRLISYLEFSQFLHDFHEEYAIEGFRRADKDGTGFISVLDFQDIMTNIKSHLLTQQVQSHLIEVSFVLVSFCCQKNTLSIV